MVSATLRSTFAKEATPGGKTVSVSDVFRLVYALVGSYTLLNDIILCYFVKVICIACRGGVVASALGCRVL